MVGLLKEGEEPDNPCMTNFKEYSQSYPAVDPKLISKVRGRRINMIKESSGETKLEAVDKAQNLSKTDSQVRAQKVEQIR